MYRFRVCLAQLFEGLIRAGVGCFILIIVFIITMGIVASYRGRPKPYHPSASGSRMPIPKVNSAVLMMGSKLYQTKGCSGCHGGIGDEPAGTNAPNLTHEGQRNASIEWQILNLKEHHRLFQNPVMPDYNELSPSELRALASYMATRI